MALVNCPICNRRVRKIFAINGQDICKKCMIEKAWFITIQDMRVSKDPSEKSDAEEVMKEHSIFTDNYVHLRAFETAIRAISQLMTIEPSNRIKIETLKIFTKNYKKSLFEQILPVLKQSGLIKDYDDDNIYPSALLEEISDDFQGNQPEIAIKKLDGIISIVTLSEQEYSSRVRRGYLSAIEMGCVKSDGSVKSFELSDETLKNACEKEGIKEKAMMNQRLKMLKYQFFFDGRDTQYIDIKDPSTGISTGKRKRIWRIKPAWVRTMARVIDLINAIERGRVITRGRGTGSPPPAQSGGGGSQPSTPDEGTKGAQQ